ncbi:MAG: FtsX-like permease family protein [Acidobacteria bacterium]|nr:FtsX-like permease family protein [Acidobacteriota bacterium]
MRVDHEATLPLVYRLCLRSILRIWRTLDEIEEVEAEIIELRRVRLKEHGVRGRAPYTWRQIAGYPGRLALDRTVVPIPDQADRPVNTLLADARTALRALPRSPLLTCTIIAVLALSIGATTTIYSVVHTVLIEDLEYPEPDRVVGLWLVQSDLSRARMTPGNLLDARELGVLESLGSFRRSSATFHPEDGDAIVLTGTRVTDGYFESLARQPIVGRPFNSLETSTGGPSVVMLGERFWSTRLGRDAGIIGRVLILNDTPREVVGVMPSGVYPAGASIGAEVTIDPDGPDFWIPERFSEAFYQNRRSHLLGVVGRLDDSTSFEAAQAAVATLGANLGERDPMNAGEGLVLTSFRSEVVGAVEQSLVLLLLTVAVVLAIGGANVAALLLVRAESRQAELALRAALGAGRSRLVQLFVETAILAAVGGGLGVLLAPRLLDALRGAIPTSIPRMHNAVVDWQVLGVSTVLVLLVSLLAGSLPAVFAARSSLTGALRQSAPGAGVGRTRRTLQAFMVGAQASMAVVLLVVAGLLVRSFMELNAVDLGFDSDGVLTASMNVPTSVGDDQESIVEFMRVVRESLLEIPGVTAAGLASDSPVQRNWVDGFRILGETRGPDDDPTWASLRRVGVGYLELIRTPVLDGRGFSATDGVNGAPVAVVNEAAAALYFNSDAVGRQIFLPSLERMYGEGFAGATREIVGVIGNVRYLGPQAEHEPAIYMPLDQFTSAGLVAAVRIDASRPDAAAAVRSAIMAVDSGVGLREVTSLSSLVGRFTASARFAMILLAMFGAMGLLLAAMASHALVSRVVATRLREYGIRRALGAPSGALARNVLWAAVGPAGIGTLVGIAVATPAAFAIRGQLFATTPLDPVSFAAAPVVLLLTACAAGLLCLGRALRADPVDALRSD